MSGRLRVLFVIPGDGQGSSMIFARRQADSLRAEGVDVGTFFLRSRTSPWILGRELVRFRSELRNRRPHVIHAHFGTVTAMFSALAGVGRPLVITYRGSDLNKLPAAFGLRAGLGRLFSQIAALRAARIVCVSFQLRERLWWRRRLVSVLASGVDPQLFRPEPRDAARRRLGWSLAERVVLFNAGRDPRIKRQDLAEKAVAVAARFVKEVRCETMDGVVPPDRVPALMNAADCLLLTSDSEGSPTVIQEALACDLPIVSVNAGDVCERLRGVRHTRVVERDPEKLGRALAEIVRVPQRSDGHRRVWEFSAPRIASELRRIYMEIVSSDRWNTSFC